MRYRFSALLILLFASISLAVITGGRSQEPVSGEHWPAGSAELADLSSRVAYASFGSGEVGSVLYYQGDGPDLQTALDKLAAINWPAKQLVIHSGPQVDPLLADEHNPKADQHVDWTFSVWSASGWNAFNNPNHPIADFHGLNATREMPPPLMDVYVTERLGWPQIKVPAGINVVDERADASGKQGPLVGAVVYDMMTSKPIANATIVLSHNVAPRNSSQQHWEDAASSKTNDDGKAEVKAPQEDDYRIIAHAEGYASREIAEVTLRTNTYKQYVIHLAAAKSIDGTILDSESKPMAGVAIRARNMVGIDDVPYRVPALLTTKTDDAGHFTLAGLPQGFASFEAFQEKNRLDDAFKYFAVPQHDLKLHMVPAGGVAGRVVNQKGEPVPGVHVNLQPDGDPYGKWSGGGVAGWDGSFTINDVSPGNYFIQRESGSPALAKVTVSPSQIAQVRVELPAK